MLNELFVLTIILAGTDTSRYTLTWVILYIAAHPEKQRKMQNEIDNAIGELLSTDHNLKRVIGIFCVKVFVLTSGNPFEWWIDVIRMKILQNIKHTPFELNKIIFCERMQFHIPLCV